MTPDADTRRLGAAARVDRLLLSRDPAPGMGAAGHPHPQQVARVLHVAAAVLAVAAVVVMPFSPGAFFLLLGAAAALGAMSGSVR